MRRLIEIAVSELGVREVEGEDHNERILEYARESGHSWVDDDETPWCSIFMNWVALKAGAECSGRANARSWLNIGRPVENPEPGDVVVFWRKSPESRAGHVGIFFGYSKDLSRVYVLGGNQGDQVSITAYGEERALGFRRLRPTDEDAAPDAELKRGDRGPAVADLQDALKLASFDAGTSDGIFGPRTEAAVKKLQATHDDLAITGVYDEDTRRHLRAVLEGSV